MAGVGGKGQPALVVRQCGLEWTRCGCGAGREGKVAALRVAPLHHEAGAMATRRTPLRPMASGLCRSLRLASAEVLITEGLHVITNLGKLLRE